VIRQRADHLAQLQIGVGPRFVSVSACAHAADRQRPALAQFAAEQIKASINIKAACCLAIITKSSEVFAWRNAAQRLGVVVIIDGPRLNILKAGRAKNWVLRHRHEQTGDVGAHTGIIDPGNQAIRLAQQYAQRRGAGEAIPRRTTLI
jgi:hypothetical protein